jgi:hypothetical protein
MDERNRGNLSLHGPKNLHLVLWIESGLSTQGMDLAKLSRLDTINA